MSHILDSALTDNQRRECTLNDAALAQGAPVAAHAATEVGAFEQELTAAMDGYDTLRGVEPEFDDLGNEFVYLDNLQAEAKRQIRATQRRWLMRCIGAFAAGICVAAGAAFVGTADAAEEVEQDTAERWERVNPLGDRTPRLYPRLQKTT